MFTFFKQFTLYVTMTCVCSNLSVTAAANQLEHCRLQRQDTRERMLEQVEQLKIPNRFKTMIQEGLQLAEVVNDDQEEEEEDYEDEDNYIEEEDYDIEEEDYDNEDVDYNNDDIDVFPFFVN